MHSGYRDQYDRRFDISARRLERVLGVLRAESHRGAASPRTDPFALFVLRQHEVVLALLARTLERCDDLIARVARLEADVRDLMEASPVADYPEMDEVDAYVTSEESGVITSSLDEYGTTARPTGGRHGRPSLRALAVDTDDLGRHMLEEATQGDASGGRSWH